MRDHVHTGPIAVLFAGLSAILVIHLLRILAGLLPDGVARESLASFALAD
jgi:hypothetical protein